MGIIYCIYKNGKGYTGQALRYNASGVGRIIEHINYAYGLFDMPDVFSEQIYNIKSDSEGLANLIAQYGAFNCNIRYITDESDCYGIGKNYYDNFRRRWIPSNKQRGMIDFAEFCYIWNWRNTYAFCNTQVGGQRSFVFNSRDFKADINKIETKKSTLKECIFKAVEEKTKNLFKWSGSRNFSEDRNALDSIYDFLWPEDSIFEIALSNFIYNFTTSSSEVKNIIANCLVEAKRNMKKTYTIDSISKLGNALNGITSDLLNEAFKDAPRKMFDLIKQELNDTIDNWNVFLGRFDLKLTINNGAQKNVEEKIKSSLTQYSSGSVDSMTKRVANIDWSATNIFVIKKINNKKYPSWLPQGLKISALGETDTSMIKQYYVDVFKEWHSTNNSFSDILRKYTKDSYLTRNWSEYYNGMINLGNPSNPLIPLQRTETKQYFTRANWNNKRSASNIDIWSVVYSADGKIW